MPIDLLNLEPQKISKNLRGKFMLIYSLPGAGKTTLASKYEKVLICGFEQGTNALNNIYVQPIKTWQDWKTVVGQLCRKPELKDKYHIIAVDTSDEAWNLCTKWVCSQNNVDSLRELPYGQGYDLASKEFASTFRELAYNGYGLIFTSHSTEKTFKNEKNQEYTQIVPALPNRPFDIINKMVDIIGYIREIDIGTEEKPERKRFMFFRDVVGDRFLVKSRYKYITPRVELDYNKIVNAIYDAIEKEIEHSGGSSTEESNPYTVKNFDELMEDAKLLWGKLVKEDKTEKALKILADKFGKPIKFSEILPEQINELSEVISEIKETL